MKSGPFDSPKFNWIDWATNFSLGEVPSRQRRVAPVGRQDLDPLDAPSDLVSIRVEVPGDILIETVGTATLPAN